MDTKPVKPAPISPTRAQGRALKFVLEGYGAFVDISWQGRVELVLNQVQWIPRNHMSTFVRRTAERVACKISDPQLHGCALEALAMCRDASSTFDQRRKLRTSIDSVLEFGTRVEPDLALEVSSIFCRAISYVLAEDEYEAARDISYNCLIGFSTGVKGTKEIHTAKEEEAFRQSKTLGELLLLIA